MEVESHVTPELWLRVAAGSDYATFFHTPYWAQIASSSDPGLEDATFCVRLPDREVAVYPLLRRRSSRGHDSVSTFAGCYGGPIATRELTPDELEALHVAARSRTSGSTSVTLSPLTPSQRPPAGYEPLFDTTHLLDLRCGWADILRGFSKGRRSDYKRALREGVTVRRASGTADCDLYIQLYRETVARWADRATSNYNDALLRKTFDLASVIPEHVRVTFAIHDGAPAAGMLSFAWGRHVVAWQVVAPRLASVSYATALFAASIEDAGGAGYEIFDFNPSGGHDRVAEYKQHFGAELRPVLRLRHRPFQLRAIEWARSVCAGVPRRLRRS